MSGTQKKSFWAVISVYAEVMCIVEGAFMVPVGKPVVFDFPGDCAGNQRCGGNGSARVTIYEVDKELKLVMEEERKKG